MKVHDFLRQESRKVGIPDDEIDRLLKLMEQQLGPVTGELTEPEMDRLRMLLELLIVIRSTQGERGRQFIAGLQREIEEKFEARARSN